MVHALTGMKWFAWMVLAGAMLAVSACDALEGKTLLAWDDPAGGVRIQVKSIDRGSATQVHLQVNRGGKEQRLVLYDKAELRVVTLLHYNDWILVLSGPYVLGGYDMKADRIEAYDSYALPFTYHTMAGFPLAEKRLADGDDPEPFNFKKRNDLP